MQRQIALSGGLLLVLDEFTIGKKWTYWMGVIYCFLLALTFQDIRCFVSQSIIQRYVALDSWSMGWILIMIECSNPEAKPEFVALHNARAYARWKPHGQLDLKPTS